MVDINNLEKWLPKRFSSGDKTNEVRIALRVVGKNVSLRMYIGKSLLRKIGIEKNDKIDIFINNSKNKLFYVVKAQTGQGSYSLTEIEDKKGTKSNYFRVFFKTWLSPEDVSSAESKSHLVQHTIEDNILEIDFSQGEN